MLIRCKCGRYTNYGLTCVSCKVDTTGFEYEKDDEWEEPMDDRRGDSPLPWGDEEEEEEDEG